MSQEIILQFLYMRWLSNDHSYFTAKQVHELAKCDCDLRNTKRGISRLFAQKLIEMDGMSFLEDIIYVRRLVRRYRIRRDHIIEIDRAIDLFNQKLQSAVSAERFIPYIPEKKSN